MNRTILFVPADLAAWCGGEWTRPPEPPPTSVCQDTRRLAPGALYVALRGERMDGHDFVDAAFQRGAAAALVERSALRPEWAHRPLLAVSDTRRALGALAAGWRARWTGKMIGVTGSIGKTTVKELLACCLAAGGSVARSAGNWNNDIGLPLSLLALAGPESFGVFELGMNHAGELAPLCRLLRPDWGVVTCIAPAHMEFFSSLDEIAREKAALLEQLPANGRAFLDRAGLFYHALAARAACPVTAVALDAPADYSGRAAGGQLLVREPDGREFSYPLAQPGTPMRLNTLFAVAVARAAGLAPAAVAAALKTYAPPPMRWNETTAAGVRIINDAYNASPVSMQAALETFADLPVQGRKWLVLAGMHELGALTEAAHEEMGRRVAAGPWAGLIVVGPLGARLAVGALAAGMPAAAVQACVDAPGAARALAGVARPGDAVLFKGSRRERLEDVIEHWRPPGREPARPA